MAHTNAFNQPRVFDGDRMLGATVLSLVLGIWITLAYQGMSTPSQRSQGALAPAASALSAQVQVGTEEAPSQRLALDASSARAAATLAPVASR